MKLILLDLDETLLHSDKSISEYSIRILHECQQKGMLVGFVTARGESNILKYIQLVQPDIIISSGGALVKYQDKVIYSCQLSPEETQRLIEQARDQYEITVDTLDGHFWNYKEKPELPDWGEIIYTDYQDFYRASLKVSIELPSPELAQKIASGISDCDYVKFSDSNWYKFTKAGATKRKAIEEVSCQLGIPAEEMIAFGDDFGDIEMLRYCGIGVAMGNAIEPVKAAADVIIKNNNEDGVAHYLAQHFLKTVYLVEGDQI